MGFFLSYPLPTGLLGYPIPLLEFLGIIAAAICQPAIVLGATAVLATDSTTFALAINGDTAHTEEMHWLHLEFMAVNGGPAGPYRGVRHSHGKTNPGVDLPSRGHLGELGELARQLGVCLERMAKPGVWRLGRPVRAYRGARDGGGQPRIAPPNSLQERLGLRAVQCSG